MIGDINLFKAVVQDSLPGQDPQGYLTVELLLNPPDIIMVGHLCHRGETMDETLLQQITRTTTETRQGDTISILWKDDPSHSHLKNDSRPDRVEVATSLSNRAECLKLPRSVSYYACDVDGVGAKSRSSI